VQCAIPANKLPLQELSQLIEIKLLSSGFRKILDQVSKGVKRRFPPLKTPMATDALGLLFTQHQNAWLAAISNQSLPCYITCHDVCVQKQCCHRLVCKNHYSQKKSLDLRKLYLI